MSEFQVKDRVVVVAPEQPTGLRGGETGVVTVVRNGLVRVRRDDTGREVTVYPRELRHA
ncbi:hypothetical protein ACFXO2_41190 [Streptomyces sp. NPDC059152]|uniref:hypothetical protein n=1 Tax=Streptomyces sp. NPDC059152 TaxID=3346742 RepID=UPI00367961C3